MWIRGSCEVISSPQPLFVSFSHYLYLLRTRLVSEWSRHTAGAAVVSQVTRENSLPSAPDIATSVNLEKLGVINVSDLNE